jgi:ribose 5-phosphate isomerase A
LDQDLIETAKKNAAEKAVEENIKNDMILGIGSGSTIVYAVKKIAEVAKKRNLSLVCIPSSFQANLLIIENGLTVSSLDQNPEIDLDIDGADEIDSELNAIKGGGGCLVQEKIIASNSKELILIVDYRKRSNKLGASWKNGVPIEIIPRAHIPLMKKFSKFGGKPKLRMAQAKSGPLVTDNGNFIIDVDFGEIDNPSKLNKKLYMIPGIVDTGLFINMASKAYIGLEDGKVQVLSK